MDGRVKNMIGYRDISRAIKTSSFELIAHGGRTQALYRIPFLLRVNQASRSNIRPSKRWRSSKICAQEKTERGTKYAAVMDKALPVMMMLAWLSEIGLQGSVSWSICATMRYLSQAKGTTKVTIKHGTKYSKEREVEAPKWLLDTASIHRYHASRKT